jgi:hypothetical protein
MCSGTLLNNDNNVFQFAVVQYSTKYGSDDSILNLGLSSDSSSDDEDWREEDEGRNANSVRPQFYTPTPNCNTPY